MARATGAPLVRKDWASSGRPEVKATEIVTEPLSKISFALQAQEAESGDSLRLPKVSVEPDSHLPLQKTSAEVSDHRSECSTDAASDDALSDGDEYVPFEDPREEVQSFQGDDGSTYSVESRGQSAD